MSECRRHHRRSCRSLPLSASLSLLLSLLCFPQRKSNLIVVFLSIISCFSIPLSIHNIHDNTFLFIFITAETFFAGDIFPYLHIFYIHIFKYNSYFIVYFIPPSYAYIRRDCVQISRMDEKKNENERRRRTRRATEARRHEGSSTLCVCTSVCVCVCVCVRRDTRAKEVKRNRWKTDTRSRCSRRN